jgi:hypothetical protein
MPDVMARKRDAVHGKWYILHDQEPAVLG